ncbi:RNA polymerase III transcription factor IIIC subunit-domain-containing protein [Kockovaella imperatae]|uniref:RNA polymerase III transcription factor IIIC subunit-domain-containing protein n=1 Tax=Kockovaella imperatae TaxID=4999 RepID=A0A1Y1UPJ0_9TREE|nr:RNA polymerase III transcription factor IIIC subunit-domain-containing protein [Kockovaella imperatae]ORX39968.1 RNA polymerase III transcription factor IIIC subunit-domain-containing protein [Kockovaella imperatae]
MSASGPSSVPMDIDTPVETGEGQAGSSIMGALAASVAPFHTYPKQPFASIEYLGPVSHPSAILKIITQEDINTCLNSTEKTVEARSIDMRYKPGDLYAIPVKGLKVPSQKLLLKVVRKKRRPQERDTEHGARTTTSPSRKGKQREGTENGIFTAEVVGPLTQTIRFKSMGDWHYTPDQQGRTAQIIGAMRDLDYDAILEYSVPPLDETFVEPVSPSGQDGDDPMEGSSGTTQLYRSLLDLQALPVFSDRRVPLIWNYKNHTQAYVEDYEDKRTGETKQRYVNRARHVAYTIPIIGHNSKNVPKEPVKGLMDKLKKADQRIMEKMRNLLAERPVWLRHVLLRQFSEADRRVIILSKAYFPAFVYTFGAGPFWKCLVRYGYDPRHHVEARLYQRIYFYLNVTRIGPRGHAYHSPPPDDDDEEDGGKAKTGSNITTQAERKSQWEAQQERLIAEGKRPPFDPDQDYIFDGKILQRDVPDFQLCDITDPLIRKYIDDPALVGDKCAAHDGWYKPAAYALIKALTRIKFTHIRDNDEPAPDSICFQAIEDFEAAMLEGKSGEGGSRMADDDDDEEHEEEDEGDEDEEEDEGGEGGDDAGEE